MKCETEIAKIRIACRVAAQALQLAEEASFPGITTAEVFFMRSFYEEATGTDSESNMDPPPKRAALPMCISFVFYTEYY